MSMSHYSLYLRVAPRSRVEEDLDACVAHDNLHQLVSPQDSVEGD